MPGPDSDLVQAARRVLVERARDGGEPITYKQLGEAIGVHPRQVGPVLERVKDAAGPREPDITKLVVRSDTGKPSVLNREAFRPGDDLQESRWQQALEDIREYGWGD